MLVTLVIGTKIRRRPNTSATRPSTRGWCTSDRTATTRSRTLPTCSPTGSKIGRPTRRAAKTRAGAVLTFRHATGPVRLQPARWDDVGRVGIRAAGGAARRRAQERYDVAAGPPGRPPGPA